MLPYRTLSLCVLLLSFASAVLAQDDEYAAILAFDESLLKQRGDGWHGGVTFDNAVHPDDGNANSGFDLRYLRGAQRFDGAASAVESAIWWANAGYSYAFFSNETTKLRAVARLSHDHDFSSPSESTTRFNDKEDTGTLALAMDNDFEHVALTTQLQTQWRRFARQGDTEVLQQPLTIDVEKKFRTVGFLLSLDWYGDALDASLWSRISRVTDTDVSVCIDQVCLLTDAIEENFTLYEGGYHQIWYSNDRHDGISVLTEISAFSANVDHLPSNYRFSVGGMYSVRGYDEGVIGGDEVAWLRNELRWSWRAQTQGAALGLDRTTAQQVYLLYDWGLARQNAVDVTVDGLSFTLLEQNSTQLRAAGCGLALWFRHDLSLRLEYAVVLAALDQVADKGDASFRASLDWRAF